MKYFRLIITTQTRRSLTPNIPPFSSTICPSILYPVNQSCAFFFLLSLHIHFLLRKQISFSFYLNPFTTSTTVDFQFLNQIMFLHELYFFTYKNYCYVVLGRVRNDIGSHGTTPGQSSNEPAGLSLKYFQNIWIKITWSWLNKATLGP